MAMCARFALLAFLLCAAAAEQSFHAHRMVHVTLAEDTYGLILQRRREPC
jgi:hypothetical protein